MYMQMIRCNAHCQALHVIDRATQAMRKTVIRKDKEAYKLARSILLRHARVARYIVKKDLN